MISIVDYNMGNLGSIRNALEYLDEDYRIVQDPNDIMKSTKIILPGVGNFSAAIRSLRELNIYDSLNKVVLEYKIPILGICLGMQIMAELGEEGGTCEGLGWIKGRVRKLISLNTKYKIPHVGFNDIKVSKESVLFNKLDQSSDFYFVHSYMFECDDKYKTSICEYCEPITSSIEHDNIFGVQFHPEKSQSNGLKVLKNFASLRM